MNIEPAWIITGLLSVITTVLGFILKEKNSALTRLENRVALLELRLAVQDQWNKAVDEKLDRIIKKLDA